jgi:Na+/melibiose symporter-like transporter
MPPPETPAYHQRQQDVESSESLSSDTALQVEVRDGTRDGLEKSSNQEAFLEVASLQSAKRPARPTLAPGISSTARRPSFIDDEEDPIAIATAANASSSEPEKEAPVTWMSLPKKGQLAVLTISRLVEPLTERSLAAYMFYQLRYFNPDLPDSTIASQGGMLTASFAAAQFLTAVWWGRAADTPWIGRKRVLLVGLLGTCVSCLGVGFAKSFGQALFFRACAGCLNGNVGVMRTMISEIIKEKKYVGSAERDCALN